MIRFYILSKILKCKELSGANVVSITKNEYDFTVRLL